MIIATAEIPEKTTTDWKRLFGVTQYCLPTAKAYEVLMIQGIPRPRKTLTELEPAEKIETFCRFRQCKITTYKTITVAEKTQSSLDR